MTNIDFDVKWSNIKNTYDLKVHPNLWRSFLVQNMEEWGNFTELSSKLGINVGMEIGTNVGGSFYTLCQIANDDATLISLDDCDGPYLNTSQKKEIFIKEFSKKNQTIEVVSGDSTSKETIDEIEKILNNRQLDYLFIDGGHDYNTVKSDYTNYKKFVKDGGLIAFHDIYNTYGVSDFWNEINIETKSSEVLGQPFTEVDKVFGIGIIWNKRD